MPGCQLLKMPDLRYNDIIITISPTLPPNLSAIWLKLWIPDDISRFSDKLKTWLPWQRMKTKENFKTYKTISNNVK